jgi:hypothetical protein
MYMEAVMKPEDLVIGSNADRGTEVMEIPLMKLPENFDVMFFCLAEAGAAAPLLDDEGRVFGWQVGSKTIITGPPTG